MSDHPTNGGGRPRTKTRAQERADEVPTPTRLELAERVEQLTRELEEARTKSDEHLNNWQRSAADFANFKRRTDEERATLGRFSTAALIGRLLSVLDDFDRALDAVPPEAHDAWTEGVKLVERMLGGLQET